MNATSIRLAALEGEPLRHVYCTRRDARERVLVALCGGTFDIATIARFAR